MATEIELEGPIDMEVEVDSADGGEGFAIHQVTLTITADDDTKVTIQMGSTEDDMAGLVHDLEGAAKEARRLMEQWETLPDPTDAFVYEGRHCFTIQIEQVQQGEPKGYPSQAIAEYELAAAMTKTGTFPNCWYVNERGNIDDIGNSVRKYHDEGGTELLPLAGVVFQEDAAVMASGWKSYVLKDWGDLGVTYVLSGDDTIHFTEDHDELTPYDEDED